MKNLLFLLLAIHSSSTFASKLVGTWVKCHQMENGYHFEHYLDFGKNNVELEAYVFYPKSAKSCKGNPTFVSAHTWHYIEKDDYFYSTFFVTQIIAESKKYVKVFNKNNYCDLNRWEQGKPVHCLQNDPLGLDTKIGHKTNHKFEVQGTKLFITTEDEVLEYDKLK